jgi:2-C-methyl-D-erythritol 4-phosphate cytidylyltransferase / 2-C-methyl-D-erythritol 2,4-cyclodiphosphate synthase
MHVTAIIAAGGAGVRLGAGMPKQFLELGGRTILERSVGAFLEHDRITDVIVVLPPRSQFDLPPWPESGMRVHAVAGGARRQDSVANAFDVVPSACDVVLIHDAARPFVSADVISRVIDAAVEHGAAIAGIPVSDTVKQIELDGGRRVISRTIPRESVFLAQTPQGFRRGILAEAVALGRAGTEATDEALLAEAAGHRVELVEGSAANSKITTPADLEAARQRSSQAALSRVGTGYDLHRLVEGRPLIIGGVEIPAERGALGHSDADVACHAATDALLGAACLGDIGRHFPDTDPRWKGASSIDLLRQSAAMVQTAGFAVQNLDVVIVLERPKIAPHLARIREGLAAALGIPVDRVSVKGKTNEGVDAVGRGEAIAAHAVVLVLSSQF